MDARSFRGAKVSTAPEKKKKGEIVALGKNKSKSHLSQEIIQINSERIFKNGKPVTQAAEKW